MRRDWLAPCGCKMEIEQLEGKTRILRVLVICDRKEHTDLASYIGHYLEDIPSRFSRLEEVGKIGEKRQRVHKSKST